MAHKKGAGSSKNGRESHSKRLGIKIFGGEFASAGNILLRQRGTVHHPGRGVGIGKDHTLFALTDGIVNYQKGKKDRSFVSILPIQNLEAIKIATPVKGFVKSQTVEAETIQKENITDVKKKEVPAAPNPIIKEDKKDKSTKITTPKAKKVVAKTGEPKKSKDPDATPKKADKKKTDKKE